MAQIEEIFSRYGQLRSIQKIFGTKGGSGGEDGAPPGGEEGSAFRVEYFNIQVRRRRRRLVHAISHLCITLTDRPCLGLTRRAPSPSPPCPYPTSTPPHYREGRASRGVGAQRHLHHAARARGHRHLRPLGQPQAAALPPAARHPLALALGAGAGHGRGAGRGVAAPPGTALAYFSTRFISCATRSSPVTSYPPSTHP